MRFFLQRGHDLAGFHEMTRFVIGLLLSKTREHLGLVEKALICTEKLAQVDNDFFLTFLEVAELLDRADFRGLVRQPRVIFVGELDVVMCHWSCSHVALTRKVSEISPRVLPKLEGRYGGFLPLLGMWRCLRW